MITQTQAPERAVAVPGGIEWSGLVRGYAAPVVVTLLVVAGSLFGGSALVRGATGAAASGVRLEVGWGYLAMAPVGNVLDTLSVLTLPQHFAVLATLLAVFVLWRLLRSRRRLGWGRRLLVELGVAALSLVGLAAFYGYGMFGPRPMAALVVEDDSVVVVDVHSHTNHSHDGLRWFDAEANRAWHAAAGFHAAYVSDHRTWDGYLEAEAENPERAGEGVSLLPALEIKYAGKYASALGPPWQYRSAAEGNVLIEDSVYRLYRETGVRPTLVLTLPSGLEEVVASRGDTLGYVALELNDASPRGLRQSRGDRALLLRMADSLDLALVAASNNHGWGRTAAAWTLLRIPGWRELSPDELAAAIEARFHAERRQASWVVERRIPWTDESPVALAATVPAITWSMFGGLSVPERVSWLLWSWVLAGLLVVARARRARGRGHHSPGG